MPHSSAGSVVLRVRSRLDSKRRATQVVALATFFLIVPGCSLVTGGVVAEALFQIDSVRPKLLDADDRRFDAREYAILQKTQVELLKSWFVLNSALRDPGIGQLSILADRDDPVAWLQKNLEVEFLEGSVILAIRLRGTESESEDLKLLVDRVAKAYDKEVVFNAKQRRLILRDAKAKAVDTLGKELAEKLDESQALKKELRADSAESSELQIRQIELDVLTDVYRQLRRSLRVDDIESNAPARIRMIQPAVVSQD